MKCPQCGSEKFRRSATRWSEKPRRVLLGQPKVRCRDCDWRGWREPAAVSGPRPKDRVSRHPMTNSETLFGALFVIFMIVLVIGIFTALARPKPVEPPLVTPAPRQSSLR